MSEEKSLQGWTPTLEGEMTLARVIDMAFDYRGNVTIAKTDGTEFVGYVSNRNREAAVPFLQYFDEKGEGPFTLPYGQVKNIRFTGKDTALGNSYDAYQKRKAKQRETGIAEPILAEAEDQE